MKKLHKKIHKVGLVANAGKLFSREIVRKAVSLISRSGRTVLADEPTAKLAGLRTPACPSVTEVTQEADVLLVFGGDGTMLRVAREVNGARTPILGINLGGLGFLTAVPSGELSNALQQLWKGDFTLESRPLIEAAGRCERRTVKTTAFNEFVISRGLIPRLIELDVAVDSETLTRYRCDGLIVSSPTGSTAYSLSAGGAVVYPTAEVFTITPICPHTLSNRSVIVSLSSKIQVTVVGEESETLLSADGERECSLSTGDSLTIRRSRHEVRLVRLAGASFFETLRHKLHWRGSSVPPRI